MTNSPILAAQIERWPIAGHFAISRGAKTEAVTVVAEISRGGRVGRGECVPYPRYGETPEATLAAILSMPEAMAAATAKLAHRQLLKIKLGAEGDGARIAAVREAAPRSELIVDANEGWTATNLEQNLAECAGAGVTLVEQPLPAGNDEALARIKRPLSVCAD